MIFLPIEWILVVNYGKSAHRAIYGRLPGEAKYSKDYIQLSRKADFIEALEMAFPALKSSENQFVPIQYKWPLGSTEGKLFRQSADRPHLAWETSSAPAPWKMTQHPTEFTVETISGNPSYRTADLADGQYQKLIATGFGQPYLIAVKLRGEDSTLHLRVHVHNPSVTFQWADLSLAPEEVRTLAAATSQSSALAWRLFSPEVGPNVLCFDPTSKVSPWKRGYTVPTKQELSATVVQSALTEGTLLEHETLETLETSTLNNDLISEELPFSDELISEFESRVRVGGFAVSDATATVKTRGSAQRVFAKEVKGNYNWRCAVTGIRTREFLVASHIVPWSVDEAIRLDPSNGICLSVLIDRAFESGFLVIQDDLVVTVNWGRIAEDEELKRQLGCYEGVRIAFPRTCPPKVDYLRKRRSLYEP